MWLCIGFLIYAHTYQRIELKEFQDGRACAEYGREWVRIHSHKNVETKYICEENKYASIVTSNI